MTSEREAEAARPSRSVAAPVLVLASGSPRRVELLGRIVDAFEVDPANTDETQFGEEVPTAYVARVAVEKAESVSGRRPGVFVLGADTTVALDGEIIGKPADDEDAREMLAKLSGRTHEVITGVALVVPGRPGAIPTESLVQVAHTEVTFGELTAGEIDSYVAGREPMGKAGAYAIQSNGGVFVERIRGDPSTVIGLPLRLTRRMLRETAFPLP